MEFMARAMWLRTLSMEAFNDDKNAKPEDSLFFLIGFNPFVFWRKDIPTKVDIEIAQGLHKWQDFMKSQKTVWIF